MQAFEGVRVLDLTHVLAGPFASYQLAVLGADVIKIESPGQTDMNREVGPFEELNAIGRGAHFQSQAANKRAITLDLKTDAGRAVFLELARSADVIVENFRTGTMERLGLGYADVRAVRPDIIYCSITGFGQTGPKRGHGAFDNIIQAYSGMMMMTGPVEGPPVMMGPPVLDYGTGAQAAFAIAAALLRRARTGDGQHLDVAMLDAALMLMACFVVNTSASGQPPAPSGNGRNWVAGYGCYQTADGQLMLGAFTPGQHARLWRALDREDLAAAVAARSIADMPARRAADEPVLAEIFLSRTADAWEEHLNAAGVPAARVRSLDEALGSAQIASRAVLGPRSESGIDGLDYTPAIAAFGAAADGPSHRRPPPGHGEHTDEVLAELGYDRARIDALRRQGAI